MASWRPLLLVLSALLPACGDDAAATGDVQVFVEPEDSIPEGLAAGEDDENIRDGWSVAYEKFLIVVGDVRASRQGSDETLEEPAIWIVDLRNAPPGGYVVASFEDVAAVRWDRFGFDLPNAKPDTAALSPTAEADADLLRQGGFSVYVEGRISKEDREVRFAWGFPAGTSYDDCATEEGVPGFAVPAGGTAQVKPTIHGDHWFFTNITAGVEVTERRAQYVADADLDGDGETTLDELRATNASEVFPSPAYNLSGALGGPIETAYDFVLAQSRTLGDFQGDGECPTRRIRD